MNLSDHPLSAHEEEILKKGIKFCPFPKNVNIFQYVTEISAFQRRMRLREFFIDVGNKEQKSEWMKTKKTSVFTPLKHREANLDAYLDLVTTIH